MSFLLWALLLLLAGCIFLALEFFVPSSGTLGVLAALSFVGAIVLAFMAGPGYGTATFIAVLVIVPSACILAVKYWPDTPIGRMILIQRPESPDEVLPETVPDTVRFLAPFDPLVWDRARFEHLWGWAYRFEAYTPPAKRKLGYYALPLLWREHVIGWANTSMDAGKLTVELGFESKKHLRGHTALFNSCVESETEKYQEFLCGATRFAISPRIVSRPSLYPLRR